MAFPTTSVLSNFTGANEDPLSEGGNWDGPMEQLVSGLPNRAKRSSNTAMAGVTEGQSYWAAASFGPRQEIFVTIATMNVGAQGAQLWGRLTNPKLSSASAYTFIYDTGTGFRYFKLTGGTTYTQVGATDTSHAMAVGEKMGFEISTVSGNAKLQGYWCSTGGTWTAIPTAPTDSSSPLLTAGYIGFNTGSDGNLQLDAFGGGTVAGTTSVSGKTSAAAFGAVKVYYKVNVSGKTSAAAFGTVTTVGAQSVSVSGKTTAATFGTVSPVQPGTVPFPTTGILDNFTGTNGTTPPSANWSNGANNGDPGLQIQSNQVTVTGTSYSSAWWNASTFGPNSEAYVTFGDFDDENGQIGLFLRGNTPGTAGYDAYVLNIDTQLSAPDQVNLYRVINNAGTLIASTTSTFASGHKVGVSIIGQAITVYQDTGAGWSAILSFTDNDAAKITAAGYIGLNMRSGNHNPQTMTADAFGGGTAAGIVPVAGKTSVAAFGAVTTIGGTANVNVPGKTSAAMFGVVTGPSADFPHTGLLSSFTGADENPLYEGGHWDGPIQVTPAQKMKRVGNQAVPGLAESQAFWTPTIFNANQECWLTFATLPTLINPGPQLWLRIFEPNHPTNMSAYTFIYDIGTGFRHYKVTGTTTFTQVGSTNTSHVMLAGEKMGFAVDGTGASVTLTGYWATTGGIWTKLTPVTDSSSPLTNDGYIGFVLKADPAIAVDNFGGGSPGGTFVPQIISRR